MKTLPALGDPTAHMRTIIEGTGNRVRFWPNGNSGDVIRGHFFYVAARHFPKSMTVVDPHHFPYMGPSCWVEVIRNPSQRLVDLMRQKADHEGCRCRIILDCTAPWWGEAEVLWPEGEPEPAEVQAIRDATIELASFAHLITFPWENYAVGVHEHVGLPTLSVPDYDAENPDTTYLAQAIGWAAAIQRALLTPSLEKS